MQISEMIARKLGVKNWQVEAAVSLIDEGNTIPFIARYRKEATGTLTDEQLRELEESLTYLRSLEERKAKVMESIEAQGKMTDALKASIEAAQTLVEVEDLYLPYRPKRRTRAGIAKEKGLQGLADYIMARKKGSDVRREAQKYVSEEKEVPDAEAAVAGAMDIIAEQISDEARFRAWIREKTQAKGTVVTAQKAQKKAKEEEEKEDKTPARLKERRSLRDVFRVRGGGPQDPGTQGAGDQPRREGRISHGQNSGARRGYPLLSGETGDPGRERSGPGHLFLH